jgi:hypothetical protein
MSWENTVAAKLSPHDDRPTYECCGQGKLELINERQIRFLVCSA